MNARTRLVLTVLLLTLATSPLIAQPGRARDRDMSREDMRAMVESRLTATREREQALEDVRGVRGGDAGLGEHQAQ